MKHKFTLFLKDISSSLVKESDFAITGTTFATSDNFCSTKISKGFRLSIGDREGEGLNTHVRREIRTNDL